MKYINIILALIFSILVIYILPQSLFNHYNVKLINQKDIYPRTKLYYVDINNNSIVDEVQLRSDDKNIKSIYVFENSKLIKYYNISDYFVSGFLKIGDLDSDGFKEIYFLTEHDSLAYLNILQINSKEINAVNKVKVDSISYYKGAPDVSNKAITFCDNCVIFDLEAGFSVQPRRVYKYNFKTNRLISSPKAAIFSMGDIYCRKINNQNYILLNGTIATNNTMSFDDYNKLMVDTSASKQTLKYYADKRYRFGDFSSYTVLYNQNLKFKFSPIEYKGWTMRTYSDFIENGDSINIVSYTHSYKDITSFINIINLDGKVIKSGKLKNHFWSFNVSKNQHTIVLFNNKEKHLLLLNNNLETLVEYDDINWVYGYFDLNNDNSDEFIYIKNNIPYISNYNFSNKVKIPISLSVNYLGDNTLQVYSDNNKTYIDFQINNISHVYSYSLNSIFYLKYPFYVFIFIILYFSVRLVFKLNKRHLEKENIRLENVINERTNDIRLKNRLLEKQANEIRSKAQELEVKNTKLLELSSFKETITNTIIHDLKNPLNTIICFSDKDEIKKPASKMLNMIMNILDVYKYEDNKLILYKSTKSISSIIDSAIGNVQNVLDEKNIIIDKVYASDFVIDVDVDVFVRVIENILTNAIKFSPLNSQIKISLSNVNDVLEIKISDNGTGITPQNINKIFDKFYQDKVVDSNNIKSSGIGLTFCKLVVEAHNGSIYAENNINGGASFIIKIPHIVLENSSVKIEQVEKKEFDIPLDIVIQLKPVIEDLKNTPIYEASKIINILSSIEINNEEVDKWRRNVEASVFSSNVKHFYELCKIFDYENN